MLFRKDGAVYDLTGDAQIDAFLGCGWVPAEDAGAVEEKGARVVEETGAKAGKRRAGRKRADMVETGV